jgi:TonB family protein
MVPGTTPGPDYSYAIAKTDWPEGNVEFSGDKEQRIIRTPELEVRAQLSPLRLAFYDRSGALISKDADRLGMAREGNRVRCWKSMPSDEHYFGLGEKGGPLDKRGHSYVMWNTDAYGWDANTDPLYNVSSVMDNQGNAWSATGGAAGAVTINAVGSLPGVPLPRPAVMSTSRVTDPTKGLYKSEPEPKKPEIPPDATPLQKFEKEPKKLPPSRPSRLLEDKSEPPPGAIPYGQGGAPTMPYTQFTTGSGSQGGIGMSGAPGAAGDFATRYSWYVEALQRRISGNWLQSTIDPTIRFAPRVVVEFQVFRDGSVRNMQLTRSSGNTSVDRSALRAVQDSIPFQALPGDYAGSYVSVEFWFEFHR